MKSFCGCGLPLRLSALCLAGLAAPALFSATVSITDLGNLGYATAATGSYATFINNAGDVAGYAYVSGATYHAFYYAPGGTIKDIGTFGGSYSQPHGLNQNGEVVGTAYTSLNAPNAFVYYSDTLTNLGTLGGTNATGDGINYSGMAVGSSFMTGGSP